MKQKLTKLKRALGEADKSIIVVGDFNTLLSLLDGQTENHQGRETLSTNLTSLKITEY